MAASTINQHEEKFKYSKMLSSLFCSGSVIVLSFLCLLNNLSLDLYSTCMLLKTVIPASFCFWFLGYVIGHILDENQSGKKVKEYKLSNNNDAYSMPSMFAAEDTNIEDTGAELE